MADRKKPIVAISSEFMTAFAVIPKKQQSKVLEFITKFRENPLSPGINYEKIAQFKDQTLRSVRIDQSYRGIVKKPNTGNVYMLLWVANHDDAYNWAKNKKCTIHPETGSLQVYEVDENAIADIQEEAVKSTEKSLFESIHDRYLLKLGVPDDLIPLVRSICSDDQLDQEMDKLPAEAHEALTALAAGYTLDEVFRELDRAPDDELTVNTDDYETALENPDSKRRFYVADDDLALQEILEAPLEKWRVFLHPSQRNLVEKKWSGPSRVLGGAGTGKTVVAMHRAKWLAERVFTGEHDRILFTTFTRNLAADIKENLDKICSEKAMRKIEVVNLDRWVSSFLKKNNYDYYIDYGPRTRPLWEKAIALIPDELNLDEKFYREEWERVIQPLAITEFTEYLKAPRIGRGVRLTRKMRKAIWPVFEEYRVLLNENNLREVDGAMRDAAALLKGKGNILPYRAVVVDEAQDMSRQAFQLIRQIAGEEHDNDIFVVGDAHQRIYRHKVVLGQCGINIRGRARRLRINYRTTEEIRKWSVSLLKNLKFDDLDGGTDTQLGYKSLVHGLVPRVEKFSSFQDEIEFINQYLNDVEEKSAMIIDVCLVARTNELLRQYEGAMKAMGKEVYFIRRSEAEDRRKPGIRLATMHRVKGLEFDRVIIAGVNEGIVPFEAEWTQTDDQVIKRESETHERALLYVAATRAKKEVVVTCFGKPSRFLIS